MRVCSPQLGLDPEANLGGAVYDRELLTALAGLGTEIEILLPEGEPYSPVEGWQVTRTPRHRRTYYEYNWIFRRALWTRWKRARFDLLRVHSPYSVGPGALAFARHAEVPTILHYLHREPRRLWTLVDRMTLARYNRIITISEASRHDLIEKYGLDESHVAVVYPGVSSDCYAPPVLKKAGAGACPEILYVGGLLRRKNLHLALRALAWLRHHGLRTHFTLAGCGPEERWLRAQCKELDLEECVTFLGRVSELEKLRLLRQADIFVFPSVLEGFGFAAAEALACGVPVVGVRASSIPEVVQHGVTGLLVDDPADERAFGQAIGQLADDPRLRRQMGDAGRSDVQMRFSWRRCAEEVLAVYRKVLAS